MDSDGVREFSFAGSNYDRAYRVHRANGEGGTAEQTEAAPPEGEAETMEPGAEESTAAAPEQAEPEPAGDEEEGRSLGEYLEEIPAGYLIGIGLGVVLLTGLGD
jgi:hypothetical protein